MYNFPVILSGEREEVYFVGRRSRQVQESFDAGSRHGIDIGTIESVEMEKDKIYFRHAADDAEIAFALSIIKAADGVGVSTTVIGGETHVQFFFENDAAYQATLLKALDQMEALFT